MEELVNKYNDYRKELLQKVKTKINNIFECEYITDNIINIEDYSKTKSNYVGIVGCEIKSIEKYEDSYLIQFRIDTYTDTLLLESCPNEILELLLIINRMSVVGVYNKHRNQLQWLEF